MKVVEARGLTFYYSGSSRPSLEDVSFALDEGSIMLLVGASGCGKTTLLRAIVGLVPRFYEGKYEGDVYLNGINVRSMEMPEVAQHVGYLFQNPDNQLFSYTVERDIAFGLENLGIEEGEAKRRIEEVISQLSIEHIRRKPIFELSDGQKQVVALAGILALRPRLLLLDEPTSLLDPRTALSIMSVVKMLRDKFRISAIIVEHRLELALEISDHIMVMADGKVKVFDSVQGALKNDLRSYGVSVPPVVQLQKALGYDSFELSVKGLKGRLRTS